MLPLIPVIFAIGCNAVSLKRFDLAGAASKLGGSLMSTPSMLGGSMLGGGLTGATSGMLGGGLTGAASSMLGGGLTGAASSMLGGGLTGAASSMLGGTTGLTNPAMPEGMNSMPSASQVADQLQQNPALNLTVDQIASMESAAALATRTNQALKTELTELAGKLAPLKEEVEAIRAQGGLDEAQKRVRNEFLAHIPSSATLATLAELSSGKTATAALEAPIVFLQPAVLPPIEQLQEFSAATCKSGLSKSPTVSKVLKEEFGDLSFGEVDNRLKEVSAEYEAKLKQREKETSQLNDLEQLIAIGDASAQVKLRQLTKKMQKEENDMQRLRMSERYTSSSSKSSQN